MVPNRLFFIVLLLAIQYAWYNQVTCQTLFQTQNGVRSVHAMTQAAAAWSKATSDAAKAAKAAADAADTAVDAAKAAKGATAIARGAGKLFKVVNFIGKLAPYIGVLGFLAPFIQSLFGGEDPQMTYLKNEFFQVNKKLDDISVGHRHQDDV